VKVLGSSKFESIERDVIEQIEGLKEGGEGRVVLVVDQPDLVLAVMGEEVGVGAVAGVMGEMVLTLREVWCLRALLLLCYATVTVVGPYTRVVGTGG